MPITRKDLGIALLRGTAGSIAIGHGYTKLFGGEQATAPRMLARVYGSNFPQAVETGGMAGFTKMIESQGFPLPKESAQFAALAEFVGGLGLLAGVGTRLSGLALAGTMMGAARVHRSVGLYGQGGGEFPVLLGATGATLALLGGGGLSLDALLGRRSHRHVEPTKATS